MKRLFKSRQDRKFELQAEQLVKLGFENKDLSIGLLKLYAGDVNLVLEELYDMNRQEAEMCKEDGNKHMNKKEYGLAVEEYSKAIQLNPKNAVYYGNRSLAFIYLNDYRNAIIDANICCKMDPNYQKAYFRLGAAYRQQGNYQKAHDSYLIALQKLDMSDTQNYAFCLKKMKMCKMEIDSISQQTMNDNPCSITKKEKSI